MFKTVYIIFLFSLVSCATKETNAPEDIIEGEVKTAESVINDLSGLSYRD